MFAGGLLSVISYQLSVIRVVRLRRFNLFGV
jgi:hypothetical protein